MSSNNPNSYNGNTNNSSNITTSNNSANIVNGQQHGFSMNEGSTAKTLYVGNLDPQINEELILALFSQMGAISNCKIIHEPGNDPYCFVEFLDHNSAANALLTMNKRQCLDRELKVNWATSGANAPKMDTSKHYHIFVGDLSPDLDTPQLRDAFIAFGEISDCRVVRDPQTLKSKGYGFVSFVKKADAENAIQAMNGQWLGSRAIRTNWATRKPPTSRSNTLDISTSSSQTISNSPKQLSFEEIYNQSSSTNCTVYCGGIMQGLTEDLIQKTFCQFGQIQEIRVFKDKGYAFIKFIHKESAVNAIVSVHNTEINGQQVKCSWGKETADPNQAVAAAAVAAGSMNATQYAYPYQYWYPQGYGHTFTQAMGHQFGNAVQTPTGPASMQAYPYGQYYAQPPASTGGFNAASAAAMNIQLAWQGITSAAVAAVNAMPAGANPPSQAQPGLQPAHLTGPGSTHHQGSGNIQQQNAAAAAMIGGYPMQTYQAQ